MIIDPKLWNEIHGEINFITEDYLGTRCFNTRPTYDKDGRMWKSDGEIEDYVWVGGIRTISRLFDDLAAYGACIAQRPSSFDGELRVGDIIKLDINGAMSKIKELKADGSCTLLNLRVGFSLEVKREHRECGIKVLNGIYQPFKNIKQGSHKPKVALPPEVHNEAPIDGYRAFDLLKKRLT